MVLTLRILLFAYAALLVLASIQAWRVKDGASIWHGLISAERLF